MTNIVCCWEGRALISRKPLGNRDPIVGCAKTQPLITTWRKKFKYTHIYIYKRIYRVFFLLVRSKYVEKKPPCTYHLFMFQYPRDSNVLAYFLIFLFHHFFSLLGPFFERAPRFSQRHVPVLSRWVFVWMTCSLEQSGSSTLPTGVCGMLFRTIGINNINNGQCDRDGSKTRRWPRE